MHYKKGMGDNNIFGDQIMVHGVLNTFFECYRAGSKWGHDDSNDEDKEVGEGWESSDHGHIPTGTTIQKNLGYIVKVRRKEQADVVLKLLCSRGLWQRRDWHPVEN